MPRVRCVLLLLLAFPFLLLPPLAGAQTLIATVPAGTTPVALAINPATNKIFAVNRDSNNVTVIDGVTNGIAAVVAVGQSPSAVAVNPVTNKIYVTNQGGQTAVTVIDGATYATVPVVTGNTPQGLTVDTITNKIYVINSNPVVTVIDGFTNSVVATVTVGAHARAIAFNPVANKIYVANYSDATVTVIDANHNNAASSVPVGIDPCAIAVNTETNRVFVVNANSNGGNGSVTVIDGASNAVIANVPVGLSPGAAAVNPASNQIYAANFGDGTVSVIDGVENTSTPVPAGSSPLVMAVNPVTNKIYVVNNVWYGAVTMLDGVDGSMAATVSVGTFPDAVVLNLTTNTVYVANSVGGTVSVLAGASSDPLQFVPVTPCRVADTRNPNGPFGGPPITGGTSRDFAIPNSACGVPPTAAAYSLNVTAVPAGPLGYLTVWPTGQDKPTVSTLNSGDGRVKANAAIVPAGYQGAISVFVTNTTNVVLDIDGYFAPPVSNSTLAFYPLTPCRVADTRNKNGDLGGPSLTGGKERDFPVLESQCIPQGVTPQAYSMNFTVVPVGGQPLGYLTVWPKGSPRPGVSTLNNLTATIVANAAIVPAGTGGEIATYASNNTNLVIDIDGYFAAGQGGLSLYPAAPCRVLDTRLVGKGQPFSGTLSPPVDVVDSVCAPPSTAQAYVFNATVVPTGGLGYLTLWPDGEGRPGVSTLNAIDGAVTSNMALVPTTNGWIDAFASNPTQLVLDISSYFAP